MKLPETYLEQMKHLLGNDFEAYLSAMEEPPAQGLRENRAKLAPGEWERISPFTGERVPWAENGWYYEPGERPALDPYYHAGLYYLQEPSAMAPAALLGVKTGERILDLCAAPGGKSTELGARLFGTGGLLVANDRSNTRARALLKNLERFGITDMAVLSEEPERLADAFGCFFDRILVDAPCSGEGMFRRDPELIKSFMERGPQSYVPVQREILTQAARMLRPGGVLLYSTCTFAPEENEGNISWLLSGHPELTVLPAPPVPGAAPGVSGEPFLRFFPHKIRGEGHFIALLKKKGAENPAAYEKTVSPAGQGGRPEVPGLLKEPEFAVWTRIFPASKDPERLLLLNGQIYLLPAALPRGLKLRFLRTGLLLGEWKNGRFIPSQAAAMAVSRGAYPNSLSLQHGDERVIRYLKGETLPLFAGESPEKGWVLVCVDGWPLGWARYTGGMLKNKYHTGWRWQS